MPKFLYFHLPICILLTVNLIMFCCFNFQFACGAWRSCLTRACINNYKISAELFFLMGINWIAEVCNNKPFLTKFSDIFFRASNSSCHGWLNQDGTIIQSSSFSTLSTGASVSSSSCSSCVKLVTEVSSETYMTVLSPQTRIFQSLLAAK